MPGVIKSHPIAYFKGSGFMEGKVETNVQAKFDLAEAKTGKFNLDIQMGKLEKEEVNLVSEPAALYNIKRGEMQKGQAHLDGDNNKISGSMDMEYTDLHITPLKTDSAHGHLKKKSVKSLLANVLFIKNNNPGANGEVRKPSFTVNRYGYEGFMAASWKAVLVGLLKTVGIPEKFVIDNP